MRDGAVRGGYRQRAGPSCEKGNDMKGHGAREAQATGRTQTAGSVQYAGSGQESDCFESAEFPDAAEVMEVAKSYENSKGEDFTFEITEHIGVLKTNASGWSKEFNVVSWNGNPGKFDIREWSEDHKKMSKGITLTDREAKMLHGWIGKQRLHAESE